MIEKARTPEKSAETPEFERLSVACAGFVRERADLGFTPDKTDVLSLNQALRNLDPKTADHLIKLLQEPEEAIGRREISPDGHTGEITNRLTGLVKIVDKELLEAELAIVRAAIIKELMAAQERARQATAGVRNRILESVPVPRDKEGEVRLRALDAVIAGTADQRRVFVLKAYRASLN